MQEESCPPHVQVDLFAEPDRKRCGSDSNPVRQWIRSGFCTGRSNWTDRCLLIARKSSAWALLGSETEFVVVESDRFYMYKLYRWKQSFGYEKIDSFFQIFVSLFNILMLQIWRHEEEARYPFPGCKSSSFPL